MKKYILIFICVFALSFNAKAQVVSSTEIGIMGGGSYYLGDINSNHFDYMMPSGGIVIRKNIDRRIVFAQTFFFLFFFPKNMIFLVGDVFSTTLCS